MKQFTAMLITLAVLLVLLSYSGYIVIQQYEIIPKITAFLNKSSVSPFSTTAKKPGPSKQQKMNLYGIENLEPPARDIDELAKQINEKNIDEYIYIANQNTKKGSYENAFIFFSAAEKAVPGNARIYYNRAAAKINMKDFKGAVEDADKAIEINPGAEIAYVNKAYANISLKNYNDALSTAAALREIGGPYAKESYYIAGLALYYLGKYQDAESNFSRALDLGGGIEKFSYLYRALSRERLNNLRGAEEDINTLILINANNGAAYYVRARIRKQSGDEAGAAEDLERSLTLGYEHKGEDF